MQPAAAPGVAITLSYVCTPGAVCVIKAVALGLNAHAAILGWDGMEARSLKDEIVWV